MVDQVAKIDSNSRQTMIAVTDDASAEIRKLLVDAATGRLKVTATGLGGGDVSGPASSTDNAVVRFDGATGKIIQNSAVILDDSNHLRFGGADGSAIVDIAGATAVVQGMRVEGNAAGAIAFSTYVTADSFLRFSFLSSGSMTWGPGSGVADVTLARSGVGILGISGALTVATNVSIGTASTLDGKLKLFNSSSAAEYDIFNNDDPNIPYDSLWLQRVYSQSALGDPFASLVVVRAPENSAVISSIDTGTDVITTSAAHLFSTGTGVILQNTGGALPAPLVTGTFYAVRNLSATTLALFPTVADANANTNRINLTTGGTGTNTIYLSTQEATTTYQRMRGTINEFMDIYANGYEDSMEFGIRLQKRGTGAIIRPFVISNYDGSTRNTLAYFDNINNRIGLGGNVAPTVAVDLTGALRTTGEISVDSSGTATMAIDRGAITNFGLQVFRTAGTDEWIVGQINNSTNNFYIQDAVNSFSIITAVQGATPTITAAGAWNFTTVPTISSVAVPSISSTNTLTNKRVTKRLVTTNAPGATPTTNTDNADIRELTGLATAITSMTTNLSGTPVNGDLLEFIFLDDGTARGITWGATFVNGGLVSLPTTTVLSVVLRVIVQYQTIAALNKWVCVSVS